MRYFERIYGDEHLSHRARTVYMYLYDRTNKKKECWPSVKTIAKELALSPATVKRAIQDLKEFGYVETNQRWRENGGKSTLLYKLVR